MANRDPNAVYLKARSIIGEDKIVELAKARILVIDLDFYNELMDRLRGAVVFGKIGRLFRKD
jgi:hypothetical protein